MKKEDFPDKPATGLLAAIAPYEEITIPHTRIKQMLVSRNWNNKNPKPQSDYTIASDTRK
jgi:hypothetical protein